MANMFRRIEMADGHIRYEPADDEIERLLAVIRAHEREIAFLKEEAYGPVECSATEHN